MRLVRTIFSKEMLQYLAGASLIGYWFLIIGACLLIAWEDQDIAFLAIPAPIIFTALHFDIFHTFIFRDIKQLQDKWRASKKQ